jgi:hypothetical protein
VLSVLAMNADAQSFRAVRESTVDEAIRLLDETKSIGRLGLVTHAQTFEQLSRMAAAAGATVRSWAGVRVFTDTLDEPFDHRVAEKLIELEWLASRRDPYRRVGVLLHLLLERGSM